MLESAQAHALVVLPCCVGIPARALTAGLLLCTGKLSSLQTSSPLPRPALVVGFHAAAVSERLASVATPTTPLA
eukprot:3079466-Rhodomonas_salina.2